MFKADVCFEGPRGKLPRGVSIGVAILAIGTNFGVKLVNGTTQFQRLCDVFGKCSVNCPSIVWQLCSLYRMHNYGKPSTPKQLQKVRHHKLHSLTKKILCFKVKPNFEQQLTVHSENEHQSTFIYNMYFTFWLHTE